MKTGDRINICSEEKLRTVNSDAVDYIGQLGTVTSAYGTYKGEPWWDVRMDKNKLEFCLPEQCLHVIGTTSGGTNMIIAIRIVSVPTQQARETGKVEEIIVPVTEVAANDQNAAIALVAAQNADKLSGLKGPEIKVIATNIG